MTDQEAKKMIESVFESEYNSLKYENFVYEFLNLKLEDRCRKPIFIKDKYKTNGINEVFLLGKYKDSTGRTLDILEIYLGKNSSFSARVLQRNFVLDYLKSNNVHSVLASFVYKDNIDDWRFSFVKLDYEFKNDDGKLKVEEKTLPVKRYSYLVGKNEKTHTAKSQMLEILKDEKDILIENVEKVFSIDKVTKDFFEEYKNIFLDFNEEFEKNEVFKNEVVEKEGVRTPDFTKKLLGQIVFLYFLQKKGWLGVDGAKKWGEGDKNFLRNLFDKKYISYNNFFNDILEPLFYDTLNRKDRNNTITNDQSYSDYFKCKIPYLNGGLFSNEYNWHDTNFKIENKLFENLLDIFDKYNFTVYESDPLEKEVAVDPEMLGKVFENLLEIKDRKSKGAFYTPREIVHYMCQESLINYLLNNSEYKEDQIRDLFIKKDSYLTDEEKEEIKNNKSFYNKEFAEKVNTLLKNVKIVDPAVGSGAFPMGMLKEIVSTRYFLNTLFLHEKNKQGKNLTEYDIKKETLENCIYGVDLEKGAVDIARLRFWLSLVVEHSIEEVEPLPNLDYKIMQGNSLLEDLVIGDSVIELDFGSSLNVDKRTKEYKYIGNIKQMDMGSIWSDSSKIVTDLKILHEKFFKETDPEKKIFLKKEIDQKEDYLIKKGCDEEIKRLNSVMNNLTKESDINNSKNQILLIEKTLEDWRKYHIRPFFPWKLHFGEVFESGGFDIIVGNPPYIGEKNNKEIFRTTKKTSIGKFYKRRMDFFYFFFHKALNISKEGGQISFITTNYYLSSDGAFLLRKDIKERSSLKKIINFNNLKIFESALGQHNIITFLEKNINKDYYIKIYNVKRFGVANYEIIRNIFAENDNETDYFSINKKDLYKKNFIINIPINNNTNNIVNLIKKIETNSTPISDYLEIKQGIITGADKVTKALKLKYNENWDLGDGIFVLTENDLKKIGVTEKEKTDLIKNWITTDEVKRFFVEKRCKKHYLIYITKDHNIDNYPNIKKHLEKFKVLLQNKRECVNGKMPWYSLNWPRKPEYFEQEKILTPYRSENNRFGYDNSFCFTVGNVPILFKKKYTNIELKSILAILNSKLLTFWYKNEGKDAGGGYKYFLANKDGTLSNIPVSLNIYKYQEKLKFFIDEILNKKEQDKDADIKNFENQIDTIVYRLYDLNYEEVLIIDKNFSISKEAYENFKIE